MNLPDFPPIPSEALAAIARLHHLSISQITPLPDVGVTNKLYGLGDHLILRIPRNHPHIINLMYKEAKVVPAARAAGVQTPAILLFDDSWPSGVFLTKRYDVPYNCKIGAHSAPLVAFEPLARNPLVSLFADMSFQGTSVNVGYNSRSARHLMVHADGAFKLAKGVVSPPSNPYT